jgi:Methyltransferase domain
MPSAPPRKRSGKGAGTRPPAPGVVPPAPAAASERFRELDPYRAEREWRRYEGTPQRDLWRELRERFLDRHATGDRWVIDAGSGPGRFTSHVGAPGARRVALDLSGEMLRKLGEHWGKGPVRPRLPERIRGDLSAAPFASGVFGEVALLGNTLGFAGRSSETVWSRAAELVAPAGRLLIEVAPGPGERSRYLGRLPPSAVGRLLRAPPAAVLPRILREGFEELPPRKPEAGEFRRIRADEVSEFARRTGWEVQELIAVGPALGQDPDRVAAVRTDPKAWAHLVHVEEELGRRSDRWSRAAALLASLQRPLANAIY